MLENGQEKNKNSLLSISNFIKHIPYIFNKKPIWAHIQITTQCNLACKYCTEFDNSQEHVKKEIIKKYIDKCQELGALHIDLIGGEPLLHPDLFELLEYIHSKNMSTGITTNAFLLNEENLKKLIDAGITNIQVSIDALEPNDVTKKSLKTLSNKLELIEKHPLWLRANIVICNETIDEAPTLIKKLQDMNIGISICPIHNNGTIPPEVRIPKYVEFLKWCISQKKKYKLIQTPYYLLEYFVKAFSNKPLKWKCLGGVKSFYVGPTGSVHPCFHHEPYAKNLLDMTDTEISSAYKHKDCEEFCGVDCLIATSLPITNKWFCLYTSLFKRKN